MMLMIMIFVDERPSNNSKATPTLLIHMYVMCYALTVMCVWKNFMHNRTNKNNFVFLFTRKS